MQNKLIDRLNKIESILLSQNEKPLTHKEAAKYLNLSHSYLYKLTCSNKIPYYKPNGKKIFFKQSDLNNWLFKNRKQSISEIEQEAIIHIQKGGK